MNSEYLTYSNSVDVFKNLIQLQGNSIVNISPQGYTLRNGIDYCCVEIECNKAGIYLVQAYGKEARELYAASVINKVAKK